MIESDVSENLYSPTANDLEGELFDRRGVSAEDLAEVGRLFGAMGALREVERRLAERSHAYMKLNATSMKAIHVLMVAENADELMTPSVLASRLGISTAAVTKMLAKLEAEGHVVRQPHPRDRRAVTITVTPSTRTAARETVGRQQASRMHAALALTSQEREVVTRFFEQTAQDMREAVDGSAVDRSTSDGAGRQ